MLSPLLVSTMHSGPRFFEYLSPAKDWKTCTDLIDLLIIDEAGQVMPSVAGGMISISKNALIVGDVKQIEPVFTIPENIDYANAFRCNIVNSRSCYEQKKNLGILCSGLSITNTAYGNTMKIAQRRCGLKLKGRKENGVMLREHWRCIKEIIQYCNELSYFNLLIPSRTKVSKLPFKAFNMVHVEGKDEVSGGSRCNQAEAKAVVEWIKENKNIIEECYRDLGIEFSDLIGVVTPFNAQKNLILNELDRVGINISKVGTIHSLQGAEKKIVIFSPVYTSSGNVKSFFFDKSSNMLNVAVSRAEDSFTIVGDRKIFEKDAYCPSSLLQKFIIN